MGHPAGVELAALVSNPSMRGHIARLLLLVAFSVAGFASSFAQTEQAQLHVSIATGATTFHIGERIPLQLDFTAPPDAHVAMTNASYDRSGRMNYETFDVSPGTGFSDPLAAYFNSGLFAGGGLFGVAELSLKPNTIHLDLNEWVRFDQPGEYTVTVHSNRVFSAGKPIFAEQHPLTSNPIKLHIIAATPEWQKATLAAAVETLKEKPAVVGRPETEETRAAIATIRYLGSAESIPVMAAGLGEDSASASAFGFGLIGLPVSLQEDARRELRERIGDAETPVSGWMVTALAALDASPASSPEEKMKARIAAHQEVVGLVIAALPLKTGKAEAGTADVLLREDTGSLTAEDKDAIARALSSTFLQLPEENQAMLLGWQWDVVRSAISTQVLEQIAELPVGDPGSHAVTAYERVQLKASALERLYELEPDEARRLAYAAIGSAKPALTARQLWFLPAEPLPEFEPMWAQALLDDSAGGNPEVLAGLMTRFGTGEFAAQVAAKLRATLDAGGCAREAAMLAYVVKFNTDLAGPLLRDALGVREHIWCYRNMIGEVAQYATGPALTDVAMEEVGDIEPEIATNAVQYLATYGDKRAQQVILNRYLSWTEEWAGKSDELQPGVVLGPARGTQSLLLGEALGRALLVNQGWMADDHLRSQVLSRCVGEQMRLMLEQAANASKTPYMVMVTRAGDGRGSVQVGPYEIPNLDLLKAKLSQFPRGTEFNLVEPDRSGDAVSFGEKVRAVFDEAGMRLTKPS